MAENVDALRFTAEAHRRIFVVETMGRTAGWIALGGGLASYADAILLPERPFDRAKLLAFVREKQKAGRRALMIVCSEGARALGEDATVAFHVPGSPQSERFGGIANNVARWLEKEIGWEARHALEGVWGQAVVYRQGRVQRAPVTDLMQPPRLVPPEDRWVQQALDLGIFI